MNKLEILLYPDKKLRQVCKPITAMNNNLDKLIDDMLYTMYNAPGIGLAAPQVGVLERLIVVDISDDKSEPIVLLNPEVINFAGNITWEEGCLSLPGVYANIERPAEIVVRAMNRDGKAIELEASDLTAICIQHEIDHLNGKMFIDHLSNLKKVRIIKKFKKDMEELEQE